MRKRTQTVLSLARQMGVNPTTILCWLQGKVGWKWKEAVARANLNLRSKEELVEYLRRTIPWPRLGFFSPEEIARLPSLFSDSRPMGPPWRGRVITVGEVAQAVWLAYFQKSSVGSETLKTSRPTFYTLARKLHSLLRKGRRRWTNESIIAEIQRLYREGENLSARNMQMRHSALFSSARSPSHFGSWRAAVEAAGLDYDQIRSQRRLGAWTKEGILEAIRRRYAEGKSLAPAAVRREDSRLFAAARSKRHFGSWSKALEAAGVDYTPIKGVRRWNREKIVQTIRELYAQGVDLRWSNIDRVNPSLYRAARLPQNFGSWRNALQAAGLRVEEFAPITRWTKERILEEIRRLHHAGHDLSLESMRKRNPYLVSIACQSRFFGSWEAAVAAADLERRKA